MSVETTPTTDLYGIGPKTHSRLRGVIGTDADTTAGLAGRFFTDKRSEILKIVRSQARDRFQRELADSITDFPAFIRDIEAVPESDRAAVVAYFGHVGVNGNQMIRESGNQKVIDFRNVNYDQGGIQDAANVSMMAWNYEKYADTSGLHFSLDEIGTPATDAYYHEPEKTDRVACLENENGVTFYSTNYFEHLEAATGIDLMENPERALLHNEEDTFPLRVEVTDSLNFILAPRVKPERKQ